MEITRGGKEQWTVGAQYGAWKVGILAYGEKFSKFSMLERHNCTDEAFMIVEGSATLYVADKDLNVSSYEMERGAVYNVKKGEWHHIVVSRDAIVMVVENSSTSSENTDIKFL